MPRNLRTACLLLGLLGLYALKGFSQPPQQPAADPFARWEKEIAELEAKWQKQPPKTGGIVFTGSSSIRLWKLDESFPDWEAVNAGFGGSHIADVNHFVSRLVLPHKPRTIVFYAGDNDIASKKSARQVRDDFLQFTRLVHKQLPETDIFWLPVKPSLKRWSLFPVQREANDLVAELCQENPRLHVIDTVPPMLGDNGEPRPELFVKDGLHLSPEGYKIWDELVKQAVTGNPQSQRKADAATSGAR